MDDHEIKKVKKTIRSHLMSIVFIWITAILLFINLTTNFLGKRIFSNVDKIQAIKISLVFGLFISLSFSYNFIYDFLMLKKKPEAPIDDFYLPSSRQIIEKDYSKYFEDKYIFLYKMFWKYGFVIGLIELLCMGLIIRYILSK